MSKKKDLNKIAKIEKAIAKKYGMETIINPKSFWSDEKEAEYLEQVKQFYKKDTQKEKVQKDGFLLSKNLITKENKRKCPVCEVLSFKLKDDLYMNKFDCCFNCYIQHVEFNEEKWLSGWRPDKPSKETK